LSSLALLGEIIAQGTMASAATYRSASHYRLLTKHGYLGEAGIVSSVVCSECDNPHDAEIVYEGNQYGYFCPDLGFVSLQRQDIVRLEPSLHLLIERLADCFACKRRKATPLHGRTWRIGAMATDHGDVALYFHPLLRSEDDARNLAEALAREMSSPWRLIVTAEGGLPTEGALTISLGDLVELDPQDGRLILTMDLHAAFDIPKGRKGGRPNTFGPLLQDLIQARIANGQALPGRNEEAKAVLALFEKENPGNEQPSLSSAKTYVTKVRTG
jgi:hypothetical protein